MNNKNLYKFTNFIIYSLIIILIIMLSYNILILYKKYNSKSSPKNSINVSPSSNDSTKDVLLNN